MYKVCAVTGSFDPVTLGHVSIVKKALQKYETVYVLMLINPDKTYTFSKDERLKLLKETFKGFDRVIVDFYGGYTADYCKEHGIEVLVRGIRNDTDLQYEKKLAQDNYDYGGIETIFFDAEDGMEEISSNLARKKIANDESLYGLLPEAVINTIKEIKKK